MTDERTERPWLRTATLVLVAVAVVLAVGGSIAWAFTATFASPNDDKYGHFHQRTYTVVGRIQTEVGDTWTVDGPEGRTLKISVTPQTVFGTADRPSRREQFVVGDSVTVRGTAHRGSIDAATVAAAG